MRVGLFGPLRERAGGLLTTLEAEIAEQSSARVSAADRWRTRLGSVEVLVIAVLLAIVLRGPIASLFSSSRASTFATVFVSVVLGGLPFLVLGVAVVAAVAAFVPASFLDRALALPRVTRVPALVVPAAAVAGVVMPAGDEAASTAAAWGRRGAPGAAVVAYLLASPAVSPVVLVATAIAFPGHPMMVLARLLGSLLTAMSLGFVWLRLGRPQWLAPTRAGSHSRVAQTYATARGWPALLQRSRFEIMRAGGFLAVGAFVVAVLTVSLPAHWLDAIAGSGFFAIVAMALLAVLLSVRAESDAFVAAAASQFSLTARLAYLVVGPAVNLRLFTRQVATFGPRFAVRVAPLTLLVGVLVALAVGAVLL